MSVVASNVPPVITPVVVIVLEPVSIVPKPLVILPLSNAPVETMLELHRGGPQTFWNGLGLFCLLTFLTLLLDGCNRKDAT